MSDNSVPAATTAVEPVVVMVTTGSVDEARAIAQVLVQERLAACVNILPAVESVFFWQGTLQEVPETIMLIKTIPDRVEAIQFRVRSMHSYQVFEMLVMPTSGANPEYRDWILEQTENQNAHH